ncbi:alkaline phosphatase D family protein [Congregibacter variabilis]|uniref:alkaline phosphatase D family protein n=1 Tax=Congregibacter variabilis TaxID=3081200 RepID=UPI00388D8BE1
MTKLRGFCALALGTVALFAAAQATAQWPETHAEQAVPDLSSRPIDSSRTITQLAFGSCYKAQRKGEGIWRSIAATNPQLFIFAGDTLYPDKDDSTAGLPNLRAAYRMLGNLSAFRDLRSSTSVLPVWDDHDFGRNDGGADFLWQEESERLFESSWGIDAQDPRRQRPGVYFSESLGEPGHLLQIIVLDTRYFRSPLRATDEYGAKGKERYIPDTDTAKTMLGPDQWAWLETQLRQSADLRLIVSSVQVLADGHGWEGWKQLPLERERLFAMLRAYDDAPVIVLSGDRHVAGFYEREIGLRTPLVEFTSSSLNNPVSFPDRYATLAEEGPQRLGELYGDANFGSLQIDWKAGVVELLLHDASGAVVQRLLRNLSY